MRSTPWLVLGSCLFLLSVGCAGNKNNGKHTQCSDGIDNDADGLIDFPADPGCTSADDDTEDSLPSPQCNDGRDNDGDGKVDYPNDPGCYAPQQDDETDDCPNGPGCPQCSDGKDNDNNGIIDFPGDPGCTAASDTDEYTENPVACGSNVHIKQLPFDNHISATIMNGASGLQSPTCGGTGIEDVYELRLTQPKVVVATTDTTLTSADTVLYIRGANCVDPTSEKICNDDVSSTNKASTITVALQPGTYYLVVDAHDAATSGSYDLTVHFYVGEGVPCQSADECGPGLVCRVPLGGTDKVCSKHECEDGVDNDADGKIDYPNDPGCLSPKGDDETDTCPNGASCPECGNGRDDDGDGFIDYPADPQCLAASSASEACVSHEPVVAITTAMTMGDTTGQTNDFKPACGSSVSTAPDRTYRLDVPLMTQLNLNLTATWDTVSALYNSTCGGTAISCSDPLNMTVTNVAAGTYYYVVDGYSTSAFGPFTINVSGKIANAQSCESALAQSGAITCGNGYACKGTVGSRTCQPALCSDGIDNDGDGKIDYPFDPGCDSPADDTEANPAILPVCSDGINNDPTQDTLIDFPADFGCAAASDTSEVFCMVETDVSSEVAVTAHVTTGTTTGKANDLTPGCSSFSTASDVTVGLQLPVPVVTLVVDTIGSAYDTVLTMHDTHCAMELGCDDDSGGSLKSKITLSNVGAGNYSITVDGYSSNNGAFTLNVLGTVAPMTSCVSPLFVSGVLACPSPTTCTGTPKKCQ
jgi:hypothetical protein